LIYTLAFLGGGNIYCLTEILYRSRTHYSMFFCAGMAVVVLLGIYTKNREISPLLFALIATGVITGFELVYGLIFNVILKENVWDYSSVPLNFLGQICLPFSAIWAVFGIILYGTFKAIKI
jgi:hypothetical protein